MQIHENVATIFYMHNWAVRTRVYILLWFNRRENEQQLLYVPQTSG